jgi:UDP-glucose 4-epimerase
MSEQTDEDHGLVLVTGGCGFIGASTIRRLVASGYRVRILDNLSVPPSQHLDGVPLEQVIEGDVCDRATVDGALQGCSAVVHLAAHTSVLESVTDPDRGIRDNVGGTFTVLRACASAGVKRFVLASSNAVLGEHPLPLDESCVPAPLSPYGASKLAGEAYCSVFSAVYGVNAVALRFANAYGPFCEYKTSAVAQFLRLTIAGRPIRIYGDGLQTRDFVSVQDIAHAVVLAVARSSVNGVFQIGTGRETSVLELVRLIGEVTGRAPELQWEPQPAGELRRNFASIEKARRELGFEPAMTLADGLRETYRWLLDHEQAHPAPAPA